MAEHVLVTGALGCLGAWVARALLDAGDTVVGYDLGDDTSRLRHVLGETDAARVTLVRGDVTDLEALGRAIDEHEVSRVIHLAALQVPFVRADPTLGMRVNVTGTVAVFEAVRGRLGRIPGVAYASSAAVYNSTDPSPAPETGGYTPATLYGVSKLADEGMARVYRQDHGVGSIGLRPYVVYGPARDQGMTAGPSLAVAAAVRGEPFEIGFSGSAQYDYAPDVGRAFALASGAVAERAAVHNFPGVVASIEDVVAAIESAVPGAEVSWAGDPLPFPPALEAVGFERDVAPLPRTTLTAGIAATAAHVSDAYR
jgi:UDP-glucuronate 4-epimerase